MFITFGRNKKLIWLILVKSIRLYLISLIKTNEWKDIDLYSLKKDKHIKDNIIIFSQEILYNKWMHLMSKPNSWWTNVAYQLGSLSLNLISWEERTITSSKEWHPKSFTITTNTSWPRMKNTKQSTESIKNSWEPLLICVKRPTLTNSKLTRSWAKSHKPELLFKVLLNNWHKSTKDYLNQNPLFKSLTKTLLKTCVCFYNNLSRP